MTEKWRPAAVGGSRGSTDCGAHRCKLHHSHPTTRQSSCCHQPTLHQPPVAPPHDTTHRPLVCIHAGSHLHSRHTSGNPRLSSYISPSPCLVLPARRVH